MPLLSPVAAVPAGGHVRRLFPDHFAYVAALDDLIFL